MLDTTTKYKGREKRTSHVTYGGHASGADRVDAGSVILDDGASASLDGKDSSDLEDDV